MERTAFPLARISLLTSVYPFLAGGLVFETSAVEELSGPVSTAFYLSIPLASLAAVVLAVWALVHRRGTLSEAIIGLILGIGGIAAFAFFAGGMALLDWIFEQIGM